MRAARRRSALPHCWRGALLLLSRRDRSTRRHRRRHGALRGARRGSALPCCRRGPLLLSRRGLRWRQRLFSRLPLLVQVRPRVRGLRDGLPDTRRRHLHPRRLLLLIHRRFRLEPRASSFRIRKRLPLHPWRRPSRIWWLPPLQLWRRTFAVRQRLALRLRRGCLEVWRRLALHTRRWPYLTFGGRLPLHLRRGAFVDWRLAGFRQRLGRPGRLPGLRLWLGTPLGLIAPIGRLLLVALLLFLFLLGWGLCQHAWHEPHLCSAYRCAKSQQKGSSQPARLIDHAVPGCQHCSVSNRCGLDTPDLPATIRGRCGSLRR